MQEQLTVMMFHYTQLLLRLIKLKKLQASHMFELHFNETL